MLRDLAAAVTMSTAAAFAAEACPVRALSAVLFAASDEVGGVDEVDTYPAGLPEVEPEIASPPLRPGGVPTLPAEAPPKYQPPVYRPPTPAPPTPPRPTGQWRYRTVMSAGRILKNLPNTHTERAEYSIRFLFKKTSWDGALPFAHFEEREGVGSFTIGGTPPGSGWYENWSRGESGDHSGPRAGLKLHLADELSVEGHVAGLSSEHVYLDWVPGYCQVDEWLFGVRAGLHLGRGLTLWYGLVGYEINVDTFMTWDVWSYEWNVYGLDLLFDRGKQSFKLSLRQYTDPEPEEFLDGWAENRAYGFMGPFEETRIELSWFPTKQLKLSAGIADDRDFFSIRWDASRSLSLSYYREQESGEDLEINAFSAALRF